jgi:uncharacterized membrane protein SpoIIM required for sporulation
MTYANLPLPTREDFRLTFIVVRREVRDSFRDWRIIIPIILLTLIFPVLATITAQRMLAFTAQYGGELISERLMPFLLLVVGFFPMSFSLVIALETFVGEKERKSLEPLLSTPLTNVQLYLGKVTAALIPPLTASALGITVYMVGIGLTIGWVIELELMIQILLLTAVQGLVMVAAAVVVSSQATSVRAANLLASFIIVPMALLLQAEAVIMFWGTYAAILWMIIVGLLVTTILLVRMGVHLFNREELLGRDIDHIRLGWMGRLAWNRFTMRGSDGRYPTLRGWYRHLFAFLPELKLPAAVLLGVFAAALIGGVAGTYIFPFPQPLLDELSYEQIVANAEQLQLIAGGLPLTIFLHNLRVLALAAILGLFTFGVMGIVVFMLPWGVLSYLTAQFALAGGDPFRFLMGTVIPHAAFELPALFLAAAVALRWHAVIIAPPRERLISESWLLAAADFGRVFVGLVIPLLLAGALVEGLVTPRVLLWLYR